MTNHMKILSTFDGKALHSVIDDELTVFAPRCVDNTQERFFGYPSHRARILLNMIARLVNLVILMVVIGVFASCLFTNHASFKAPPTASASSSPTLLDSSPSRLEPCVPKNRDSGPTTIRKDSMIACHWMYYS